MTDSSQLRAAIAARVGQALVVLDGCACLGVWVIPMTALTTMLRLGVAPDLGARQERSNE